MTNTQKAVPLVTFSCQKGYELHPLGLNFLRTLPNNLNYSIITAAGKSKIGKSFLLNQILQEDSVFPVSSHLNGCTKGVMISKKVLEVNGQHVLFLDTQGFGSIDSNEDIDFKIFMIAVLISSAILYNSTGTIDEQAINGISVVVQVAKTMQKQLMKDCAFGMPGFMWVLRDFTLKLQDKSGAIITAKQYLENALEQQKGLSQQTNHKNRVRRAIKTIFPVRNCQTMVVPTQMQSSMFDFGEIQLRKQFNDDVSRLKKKLLKMIEQNPKRLCKSQITINNLINCLELIVQSLNTQNSIPKIDNLSIQVTKKQISQLKRQFAQTLQGKKGQFLNLLFSNNNQEVMNRIQGLYVTTKRSVQHLLGKQDDNQLSTMKHKFIQTIQQIKRNTAVQNPKEDEEITNNFCQYITKLNNEKDLDNEYSKAILQYRGMIKQQNFTNGLMKIQIAFLKRKLQLNRQTDIEKEKLKLELFYARKEIEQLKLKLNVQQEKSVLKEFNQNNNPELADQRNTCNPGFIRQQCSSKKIVQDQQNQFQSSSKKVENGSFYVPYVILESPEDLSIQIIKTLIKQDSKLNSYIEYVLQVQVNGHKWKLNRKYKDFCQLGNILGIMFPKVELPSFQSVIAASRSQASASHKNEKIEQRRVDLENYLCDIVNIEFIRNSRILQKFIKLNKQYVQKL